MRIIMAVALSLVTAQAYAQNVNIEYDVQTQHLVIVSYAPAPLGVFWRILDEDVMKATARSFENKATMDVSQITTGTYQLVGTYLTRQITDSRRIEIPLQFEEQGFAVRCLKCDSSGNFQGSWKSDVTLTGEAEVSYSPDKQTLTVRHTTAPHLVAVEDMHQGKIIWYRIVFRSSETVIDLSALKPATGIHSIVVMDGARNEYAQSLYFLQATVSARRILP